MSKQYALIRLWVVVVWLTGGALMVSELFRGRNPLNDPRPGWQRPGFLIDRSEEAAPPVLEGFPRPGHRLALLFVRTIGSQQLFHNLIDQAELADLGDVVVVAADGSAPTIAQGLAQIVADGDKAVARAYGLPQPNDGGYPVGYVIVDGEGYIRYRTLDPGLQLHADDLKMILRAIP